MAGFYSDNEILIFIDNLKLLRIVNGITQSKLSKSLGYSEKIIARIESNSYNLSPFLVKKISSYFGVSEKDLFKEDFEKSYLTFEKKNKMDKSALLDLEFFLLTKKTLNSAIIKTFYPIKRDFKNIRSESNEIKILSIFDLVIYIPLITPQNLISAALRIGGKTKGNEKYVFDVLSWLYNTIPNDKAKKFADYLACFNVRSNLDLNIHPFKKEINQEKFIDKYPFFYQYFLNYEDYRVCENEYYERLRLYKEWIQADKTI